MSRNVIVKPMLSEAVFPLSIKGLTLLDFVEANA
jgi:hypothetical protein